MNITNCVSSSVRILNGEFMNIIIFGPQGSGKGTQADLLVEKYKVYHLSMGDELRKEIKKGTSIGKKVEKIIFGKETIYKALAQIKPTVAVKNAALKIVSREIPFLIKTKSS